MSVAKRDVTDVAYVERQFNTDEPKVDKSANLEEGIMTTATLKKTPAKTIAKKSVAKKSVAKTPATKVTTSTPRRTDDELRALAEKLWAQGITAPFAMSKATRGTSEFVLSRRFIQIATQVIESHGGKPVSKKAARESSNGSLDTLNALKAEFEAVKKWKANGSKGAKPATPVTDKKNAQLEAKAAKNRKALDAKKTLIAQAKTAKVAKKTATK